MSSGRITIIRGAGGIPVAVSALRERRAPSSPDDSRDAPGNGNPFAPPPKGAPDRPWQPRHHTAAGPGGGPADPGRETGEGDEGGSGEEPSGPRDARPANGDRWSSEQPEAHNGGTGTPGPFGTRPGGTPPGAGGPGQGPGPYGPGQGGGPARRPEQGPGGPGRPQGAGPRFDVTDPVQRRARYALLTGMWGLFFGLYGMPEVALLMGALALYWGISSLRGKAKPPAAAAPTRDEALSAWQSPKGAADSAPGSGARPGQAAPGGPGGASPYGPGQHKPQTTAAVCGTIAGSLALAIVAVTFSFQLAYKDYFDCVNNALTQPARNACNDMLPPTLRHVIGNQG